MTNLSSNFTALDELIQVIYTATNRFIFISNVSDDWVVHVGLVGPQGRWFRGTWTEDNIRTALGSGLSAKLLEGFATKLYGFVTEGMLHVEDIDGKPKLYLGSNQQLYIDLEEMSPADSANYTSNFLLEFAIEAQNRKCAIHPAAVPSFVQSSSIPAKKVEPLRAVSPEPVKVQEEHKPSVKRKAEPAPEPVQKKDATMDSKKSARPAAKGASLANPSKKARKYQAIEFASDDE